MVYVKKKQTKDVINSLLVNNSYWSNVLKNKLLYGAQEPRDLYSLCKEEYKKQCDNNDFLKTGFSKVLRGNIVCSAGLTSKVMCEYQADELDCNGMYKCLNPRFEFEFENSMKKLNQYAFDLALLNVSPSLYLSLNLCQ
ncbi:MAG: hypothetical protein ACQESF_00920 [Nanobdellota archaeon]